MKRSYTYSFILILALAITCPAQDNANYDESKVPDYTLPKILVNTKGKKISTKEQWEKLRRPEILDMFADQMYGKIPENDVKVSFKVIKQDDKALGGKAVKKEVLATFTGNGKKAEMNILIYLPHSVSGPAPLFLGLNFFGNHTLQPDPDITLNPNWMRNSKDFGITENKATEATRGIRNSRWPVEEIIQRGYGVATIYYGDIDPDFDDGFQNGIHPLFYKKGQTKPTEAEWGAIGAWAWGLSRALDYFETDSQVDHTKVAVLGHSRLGKASLWAGAADERFALVISNDSGCGGAALSRRAFGETVQRINTSFPYWFNDNFTQYNGKEASLPFDQHMLIALMAPRPVYVASAQDDQWADPKGEYLSTYLAGEVYKLYNLPTLTSGEMPPVDQPLKEGTLGYHMRTGKHDITLYDWTQYMDFADKYFK
ncbi:MAG: acetylxylan esterase [Cyclobacteriaceae bacterium]|nr:acetylxylan esterase [Cyclobacteriaceae bacterium]